MPNHKSMPLMLCALMLLASLSGCFGNNIFIPEDKKDTGRPDYGMPQFSEVYQWLLKLIMNLVTHLNRVQSTYSNQIKKYDKPNGIEVSLTETDFDQSGSWTADDVREKAWQHKSNDPLTGSTLYWQALFPAGGYSNNDVLGVAVDASTVAIFKDAVEDAEGPFFSRPSAEEIENSVLVHEYGHLLGLVNLVYKSPVDHEDEDHPGHSNNEDSVMYWAVESADLSNIITGELPDEFDNDDLNDLAGMLSGEIPVRDQLWLP